MSQQAGPFDRLINALGKKPTELKQYVGQEVTVDAEGIAPFKATLDEGLMCYIARGGTTLQLYVGSPVTVTAKDGTVVDFRTVQI